MLLHLRRTLAVLCALVASALLSTAADAAPGALRPLGQATGAGGLRAVATSPDGRHVYAVAQAESRITAYRREASGELTQVDSESEAGGVGSLGGALSVAVSPDGLDVYVAAGDDGAVTTFRRNTATGVLALQGCVNDAGSGGCDAGAGLGGAEGVAVSPEGSSVYVAAPADNAVSVLTRNAATGDLTYVGCLKDLGAPGTCTLGEAQGLAAAQQVAVAPDGRNVYVTGRGDDAVVNLLRAPNGTLSPRTCVSDAGGPCNSAAQGLDGARAIAVSPDGRNVYVTGQIEDAVVSFGRDAGAGDLTPLDLDQHGLGGVSGLDGPEGIGVAPDGASVYIGSVDSEAVTGFTRDASGRLTFQQCFQDGAAGSGCGGAEGLDDANAIAVPADGSHIYVSSRGDASVTVFARETPPAPPAGGAGVQPPPQIPGAPGAAGSLPAPPLGPPNPPLVCVGLWTSTCAGFPRPDPVQTCVSLWQDCTGFGGSRPAAPGTIDLSGFPSSLTTRAGCDEHAGGNPFTSRRATTAQWVPADPTNGAAQRDPASCIFQVNLEGRDPNGDDDAARATLLQQFRAEVDQMKAAHLQGISVACSLVNLGPATTPRTRSAKAAQWVTMDPVCPRAPSALQRFLSAVVQQAFDAAKALDRPVQIVTFDMSRAQASCSGDAQAACMALSRNLAASLEQHLRRLRTRKAELGLDRPRTRPRTADADAATAARTRRLRVVLGSGRASLRQGRPGRVKVTFGRQARKILRTAKRRGRRSLTLTAVTRAMIVPGVTSTKRVKVKVLLVSPRRR